MILQQDPLLATNIKVCWIDHPDNKIWHFRGKEIVSNPPNHVMRFTLYEPFGQYDDFQVVIRKTAEGYVFKSDCYEDPGKEYPLKLFTSEDGIILYSQDDYDTIYFHLLMNG